MTVVDAPHRELRRQELAELLGRDVAALTDAAHLIEDLALDSLAMMSLIVWLESHGVAIDADQRRPARVGEVLSLLEKTAAGNLSIRVVNGGDTGFPDAVQLAVPRLTPRQSGSPLAPVLESPTLRLTPIADDDVNFLYTLSVGPETSFRWRYRGAPPSIDRFVADLWSQVLVQYVVRRIVDGRQVGHVVAYGAEPSRRHAYVAAAFLPEYTGTGMAAQIVATFVRYLFHTFPMAKLYLEVPGFNWPQMSSGEGGLFRVEGILRDHDYYAGRMWDKYLCAIYRDEHG